MGDVVTALGRAVKEAGHNVRVIIPKYDIINYAEVPPPFTYRLPTLDTSQGKYVSRVPEVTWD